MSLIVLDPGGTTGLAEYLVHTPASTRFMEVPDRFDLYRFIRYSDLSAVVCESFVPRGGPLTNQPEALKIIGWVEGECHLRGVPFILQTPGQAKSFATAAKLKACGFWPKGLGHAQDAGRHLLTFLCTNPMGRAHYGGEALIQKIAEAVL